MSKFLIGISGMAAVITALIVLIAEGYGTVWFWFFAVLSIPFGMLLAGVFMIIAGALMLSPFVGLSHLDEVFEHEE